MFARELRRQVGFDALPSLLEFENTFALLLQSLARAYHGSLYLDSARLEMARLCLVSLAQVIRVHSQGCGVSAEDRWGRIASRSAGWGM